jgi:uncharacterized protein
MGGKVGHFEIPADNTERARKFYSSVFDWKLITVPEMDYTMVRTGPVNEKGFETGPGYIGGGIGPRGGVLAHPVVTIVVDDIEATTRSIERHGGKVVQGKRPIGDGSMGFTAYFQDSEGNVVGLYQSPTRG